MQGKYRLVAVVVAGALALAGAAFSLTIHDSDAAETIVRRARSRRTPALEPAHIHERVA